MDVEDVEKVIEEIAAFYDKPREAASLLRQHLDYGTGPDWPQIVLENGERINLPDFLRDERTKHEKRGSGLGLVRHLRLFLTGCHNRVLTFSLPSSGRVFDLDYYDNRRDWDSPASRFGK